MFSKNISEIYRNETFDFNSKFNEPKFYINRELSWLKFNERVLMQARRTDIPLLERLKFLGISNSNLDEFIMVRFSSVLNKMYRGSTEAEISGLTPEEEYEIILEEIFKFRKEQEDIFKNISKKLSKSNIKICKHRDLNRKEKEYVAKLFHKNIYPLLTPINYDTTKEFPYIKSRQLNIVVALEDRENRNLQVMSIIPIEGLKRLYFIESDEKDVAKYILLEEIIFSFLHKIFVNKQVLYKGCMRILREADIEMDNDNDIYIVDRMKQILLERKNSRPVFMEVSEDIPKQLNKILIKLFDVEKSHILKCKGLMSFSVFETKPIRNSSLEFDEFIPQYPSELIGEHDMFDAIDSNDILLHHPYESFDPVIKFLQHAADDKKVLSIRQTLYRVSSEESSIVEALCQAAERGKQVTVLLEIKARFDEDRNISLIEKLKMSGCKLIYGVEGLKTHCKFILVVRESHKGLKTYIHIGTGNYNDKTAKIYTDLSYFTSNHKLGEDLISLFNLLSGFSDINMDLKKIYFSPYNLRSQLYKMIDNEIMNASKKKNGFILFKLNSLSDKGIIKKLYQASEKGVQIMIICRGICSMKPINKNIKIVSVVGRYLEHSRMYYFGFGDKIRLFISSADLLTRNLDKRVELLVPLTETEALAKARNILMRYPFDKFNTYLMNKDGNYVLEGEGEKDLDVQQYFIEEAIDNYKFRNTPKMNFKVKKK